MGCDCGKPKCDGHCGVSPAVLQINNPSECVLFHRKEVPANMGDSKTNPPKNGAYKNVLLYYEADQTSWLYSSDGVPQKLVNGVTNYEDAINLPQINGVTLLGNKSLGDLGITDAIDDAVAAEKAEREAADEALGDEIDDINDELLSRAVVFDTVADMQAATNLVTGSYVQTLGYTAVNDGGGADFIITDTADPTKFQIAIGALYAEIINLSSFKQMGKFNDTISAGEFSLMPGRVVDLEGNTLSLSDTLILNGITVKNGYITMGTASASVAPSHDTCLSLQSNVAIENVEFDNIDAYYTILSERGSKNITIKNCKFIDNAFSCIYFEVGNENIKVDGCYFDGIKYTVTSPLAYRYFIANGSRHGAGENTDYTFYIRNAEFSNNTCLNNPLWEGIDSHGAENLVIKNNYIYNCQTGIMCSSNGRFVTGSKHENIVIENNIIEGTNTVTRCGIIAGGDTNNDDNTTLIAKNIRITNNVITKGNTVDNSYGGIYVRQVDNFEISGNNCSENEIYGLLLSNKSINGVVSANYFDGKTAPIRSNKAVVNVNICGNTLNGLGSASYGMNNTGSGKGKFEANTIYGCGSNFLHYPNAFCMSANGATNAYVSYKDKLLDNNNNKVYDVTSTYVALGRASFQVTMTGTGVQNANYIECSTNPDEIINGMAITIGGDDYIVDHIESRKIYLTTNLSDNYTAAALAPKSPTLSAIIG